jgi:hypothetical protein
MGTVTAPDSEQPALQRLWPGLPRLRYRAVTVMIIMW